MTQIATVEQVLEDNKALIKVARSSACAHDCHDCAGCGATVAPITAIADNLADAKEGDKVEIESDSKVFFKVALRVYVLPFVLFFIGYFASFALSETWRYVIAIACFVGALLLCIVYDRKVTKLSLVSYHITRIL